MMCLCVSFSFLLSHSHFSFWHNHTFLNMHIGMFIGASHKDDWLRYRGRKEEHIHMWNTMPVDHVISIQYWPLPVNLELKYISSPSFHGWSCYQRQAWNLTVSIQCSINYCWSSYTQINSKSTYLCYLLVTLFVPGFLHGTFVQWNDLTYWVTIYQYCRGYSPVALCDVYSATTVDHDTSLHGQPFNLQCTSPVSSLRLLRHSLP